MNETIKFFTVSDRARIARIMTQRSAEVKPWRIRNKRNRSFALLAKSWSSKRGYVIASHEQMAQRYTDLFVGYTYRDTRELSRLRIWAIDTATNLRGNIRFCFVSV